MRAERSARNQARRSARCSKKKDVDWKLFGSTFVAIFIAELGDKTQLAVLSFSAGGSSRWTTFAASAAALALSSAIAAFGGELLARWVSPLLLRRLAGGIFVVMGVLFLVRKG
jgi:putative Ca2+/H+ antiporter (TMEM165/GDT1 family)